MGESSVFSEFDGLLRTCTNIHRETLALSCETENTYALCVPACRFAYTWSHKVQYFSFLGRAANVSRSNIVHVACMAQFARVSLRLSAPSKRKNSAVGESKLSPGAYFYVLARLFSKSHHSHARISCRHRRLRPLNLGNRRLRRKPRSRHRVRIPQR